MREAMSRGLAVGLLMVIAGCCLKFSNLPAGATYKVGDSITTSGTSISVEKFQWSGGDWTEDGSARIDTRGYAKGSGQDLNARNVNLRFRFDYPLKRITLKFGELGGNNNIRVNEEFKNAANLAELNGSTLGGVTATITGGQQGNNWYGTLQLNGKIDGFSIGGQELWLDDVCPKK